MPLNLSGPISLAGSTAGQSIAVEIGFPSFGQISLDQTPVRSLAGVPSGAITMPTNFYGSVQTDFYTIGIYYSGSDSAGNTCGLLSSAVNRLNSCGTIIGSQTSVPNACQRARAGAAMLGGGSMYSANSPGAAGSNLVRINSSGALIGSITTAPGTQRFNLSGARTGSNILFQGGLFFPCCVSTFVNTVTRVNSCAALVGAETNAGEIASANCTTAATSGNKSSLFYRTNSQVYRINACGTTIGSTTTAGTSRSDMGAAQIGADANRNGGLAVFYAGGSSLTQLSRVTRINSCGALVGSETNVGTARQGPGGAAVGSVGVFFGARRVTGSNCTVVTRLNVCGILVGSEITISRCTVQSRKDIQGGSS